jgi:hypothetical protein
LQQSMQDHLCIKRHSRITWHWWITLLVTYPVASDSEWQVTQEWRSIKVFS